MTCCVPLPSRTEIAMARVKGPGPMEAFVTWWCHLIFITDPVAIQTAIGFVGGPSLIVAVLIAIELLWTLLVLIRHPH
jgi:hypothetical protein